MSSPLLLGIEDNYAIIASESSGFGNYIQKYIVLENNDLLEITLQNNKITYTENIHQYKMKNNEFDGFDCCQMDTH